MATDKVNLKQTATNAAATVTAALLNAGALSTKDEALESLDGISQRVFESLMEEFAGREADTPSPTSGGGGGKDYGPMDPEKAREVVLNFGKFEGLTLGEIADMGPEEAAKHEHGTGDRPGIEYIEWLARPSTKSNFRRSAAQAVLDAKKGEST